MTAPDLRLPSQHDTDLAQTSMNVFPSLEGEEVNLHIEGQAVRVPISAVKLFKRILGEMAQGNAVVITPVHSEVTTQEAADLLNVSRPYLIGLLEQGLIAHRKVGTHRRVSLVALLEYKAKLRAEQEVTMQQLADLSQELGLY